MCMMLENVENKENFLVQHRACVHATAPPGVFSLTPCSATMLKTSSFHANKLIQENIPIYNIYQTKAHELRANIKLSLHKWASQLIYFVVRNGNPGALL